MRSNEGATSSAMKMTPSSEPGIDMRSPTALAWASLVVEHRRAHRGRSGAQGGVHAGSFLAREAHDVGEVVELGQSELLSQGVQRVPRRQARTTASG